MPTPEEIRRNVVTLGRAYVRLIESSETVLKRQPGFIEKLLLRLVWSLYKYQLRRFVEALPPELTAEILAASDNISAPVEGFSQN